MLRTTFWSYVIKTRTATPSAAAAPSATRSRRWARRQLSSAPMQCLPATALLHRCRSGASLSPRPLWPWTLPACSSLVKTTVCHVDLCIDHHTGNSGYADFTLLDGNAAAAAELLYEVISEMGVEITPLIANCLYTGLATDTGCFRFSSTTANTHLVAAQLILAGAQVEELNTLLFDTKPRERMEAERIARNHLEYHLEGRCALMYLTRDEIEQSGVDPADLEELTSLPISIEGVKVGLLLRQQPGGSYRISVRLPGVWAAAATPAQRAVSCWATSTTPRAPFWPKWRRNSTAPRHRRKADAGHPYRR